MAESPKLIYSRPNRQKQSLLSRLLNSITGKRKNVSAEERVYEELATIIHSRVQVKVIESPRILRLKQISRAVILTARHDFKPVTSTNIQLVAVIQRFTKPPTLADIRQ